MWPHLVIPFAFLPGVKESWLILSSHFCDKSEGSFEHEPLEQGSSSNQAAIFATFKYKQHQ